MTEQEYQEALQQSAYECRTAYLQAEGYMNQESVQWADESFKAGAEWARRNPGPEVLGLIETTKLAATYLDKEVRRLADDLPESLWGYLMSLIYSLNKSLTKFDAARENK